MHQHTNGAVAINACTLISSISSGSFLYVFFSRYVDRPLAGARAVQVLGRLVRRHPNKKRTLVVDFVNPAETIREVTRGTLTCLPAYLPA
jgi:hypothetical protein